MADGIQQFGYSANSGADDGDQDQTIDVEIARRFDAKTPHERIEKRTITLESPGSGQLAMVAMVAASTKPTLFQIGQMANFIVSMMSDEDGRWIEDGLLDKRSGVDGVMLMNLGRHVVEQWSAHPTEGSSDSSSQPQKTGRGSTGATRKVTSKSSTSPSGA